MPPINSLSIWLRSMWASQWPNEILLYPVQEMALWIEAVDASGAASRIEAVLSAAREAMSAATAAARHGIDIDSMALVNDDEEAFRGWYQHVRKRLNASGWLVESDLPGVLTDWLEAGVLQPPEEVELVGFTEVPRSLRRLLDAMEAKGCKVTCAQPAAACAMQRYRIEDSAGELEWVVEQVRALLMPHLDEPDRAPRIGILVPDIATARLRLEPLLQEAITPSSCRDAEVRTLTPWRFSPGEQLDQHPVALSAQRIASLRAGPIPSEALSPFLLNPVGRLRAVRTGLAQIDHELRQSAAPAHSLAEISQWSGRVSGSERIQEIFGRLRAVLESIPARQRPSDWVATFKALLEAAGWDDGSSSSTEFQVYRQVLVDIETLSALDGQVGPITQDRALFYMKQMLSRPFQTAVDHDQPVEVMTYWDAAGIQFDHVFVLGAHAGNLPPSPVRTGYLGRERFVESGALLASPKGCVEYAERWLRSIAGAAGSMTVSAAALDESGVELVESRLEAFEGIALIDVASPARVREPVATVAAEDPVPAVAVPEGTMVNSAVKRLQDYAVSPAVSFLRHRLGFKEFPLRQRGLTAALQGMLLHGSLMMFWQTLRTRDALRALDPVARMDAIQSAIERALRDNRKDFSHLRPRMLEMERIRCVAILSEWLELDAERGAPFEVVGTEANLVGSLGPYRFKLRLDRIDRVVTDSGDGLVLIDYKTGSGQSPKAWEPPQIEQPQLPLYAITTDLSKLSAPVVAIAFAQVREDDCSIASLGDINPLAGAAMAKLADPRSLDEMSAAWREDLRGSLDRHYAGDVRFARKRVQRAQNYDDLLVFLRQEARPYPEPAPF